MGEQTDNIQKKTICAGLLAHVDAGKTTVTEQLLLHGNAIRTAGSVDEGTAKTDRLTVEQKRGISVKTACAGFERDGKRVQLVDTPGHVDFAGEVERALGVLDGAVLILSAVEGVQAQTEVIERALEKCGIPAILLINKIDRAGAETEGVLDQIRESLTGNILCLETVCGAGGAGCEVSELFPEELLDEIYAKLAETDEELEERYLNGEPIGEDELITRLAAQVKSRRIVPVLFASAKEGKGIDQLISAILALLPSTEITGDGELSGVVYQIEHDRQLGKAAHVRMFGGRLSARSLVPVLGKPVEEAEKITLIKKEAAIKQADAKELLGGEIGILYGLSGIRIGDVIGNPPHGRAVSITAPLMMVQVFARREEELPALMQALTELSEEEPLLGFVYSRETRQMHVKITGTVQLEILADQLLTRYGIDAEFSKPSVLYRETPSGRGRGMEAYTMPKPCWAVVELTIEPGEKGSGIQFCSAIKEGTLPYRYQHHVETSVYQTLKQGVYGWEVTDALVTLVYGQHHHVHTHPLDFFVATPIAVLRALTDSGSTLLEPYVRLTLSGDEALLGKVIGDLTGMRGEFETPFIRRGQFHVEAVVPVADSMDYPIRFRSLTSGKGLLSQTFYDYRPCRPGFVSRLERRGVDPLDRAKWILYVRNVFGNEQNR